MPHTPIPMKPPADIALVNRDGSPHGYAPQALLPADRVRYVGQQVVMVVAETLAAAHDAAECVEIEYDVLQAGHVLMPHFTLHNVEGTFVFVAFDQSSEGHAGVRKPGRYRTTGWIPGNLLSEGSAIIGVAFRVLNPDRMLFWERDVVVFHVIDHPGEGTARGEFHGVIPGAVRPLLDWTTHYDSGLSYADRDTATVTVS